MILGNRRTDMFFTYGVLFLLRKKCLKTGTGSIETYRNISELLKYVTKIAAVCLTRSYFFFYQKSALVNVHLESEKERNVKPKHAGLAVYVGMNVNSQIPGYETPAFHSSLHINLHSFPHLTPLTFELS